MKKLLFFLLLSTTLLSCGVLKPIQKDDGAKLQLTQIKTDADNLYSHPDFVQSQYDVVDNEIANLITYDAARPNLSAIVDNVKQLQNIFSSQELRHRAKGILNSTLLSLYKQTIDDKITDIFTAENKLK
jgi:hypothetical protein